MGIRKPKLSSSSSVVSALPPAVPHTSVVRTLFVAVLPICDASRVAGLFTDFLNQPVPNSRLLEAYGAPLSNKPSLQEGPDEGHIIDEQVHP